MQTVSTSDGDDTATRPQRDLPRIATGQLEELVQAVAAGDQRALSALYQLTAAKLFAIARVALRSPEDVEDVVCDVYQYVWERARTYDSSRGSVMAWLTVVTRNRAVDRFRQLRPMVSLDDERQESLAASLQAGALGPDELLSLVQSGSAVHWALQALSEERRYLLGLSFFQGLSHEQIAKTLGMPLGTVKSHLRRALATLHRHLTSSGHEEAF